MKTREPPLSSRSPRSTEQRTFADRDAGSDYEGETARKRFKALARDVLSAPYEKVRELEEQEKGKSGRGRKPGKRSKAKKKK
jgi:hypothetical protein